MRLLTLATEDLPRVLPMREAVEAMKAAFAALSTGRAVAPLRTALPVEEAAGVTLLMGAYLPGEGLAAKIVSIFHRNAALGKRLVSGLVLVLDAETGEPWGLLDGAALTAWRTGAASGAATDLLARPDARVGCVFGAGAQARTQALAIDAVRQLSEIRVYAPNPEKVRAFAAEVVPLLRADAIPAGSPAEALREADIICTATTSATPVFDGLLLRPGTHINAVGAFTRDRRELDDVAVERSRVFVDRMESALEEAGELVIAAERGLTAPEEWIEIGLLAAGRAEGRRSPEEITLFKSVGHAVQDVAAASRALREAERLGLTREVEV